MSNQKYTEYPIDHVHDFVVLYFLPIVLSLIGDACDPFIDTFIYLGCATLIGCCHETSK